jgi:hypothetical protein
MFRDLSDSRLHQEMERLRRDIQDFEGRTHQQTLVLEAEGRFSRSEPLYQRLASIRDYLKRQLREAQEEVDRRARARARRSKPSVRTALASWFGARGRQPSKPVPLTSGGRTSSVLGPKTTGA